MKKRTNVERRQRMSEIEAMLHQSNISRKNLVRLNVLTRHDDAGVAALANLVFEVAQVAPKRQSRWRDISSQQPRLFEAAVAIFGQVRFQDLLTRDGDAGILPSRLPVAGGRETSPSQPLNTIARPPQKSSLTPASPTNDKVQRPHVAIYTDGGCEPNPGPGGYGVVLVHPRKRAETSGAFRLTTNNRMEILAVIKGLEMLKMPCLVTVYSDSQYLVKAMSQGWAARWQKTGWRLSTKEPAKNVDLWERLLALCKIHRVHFKWIKGHAGHRENERCDFLCAAAQQQKNLPSDHGYEARRTDQPILAAGGVGVVRSCTGAQIPTNPVTGPRNRPHRSFAP
jgi:ribonuclease HI